MMVREVTLTKSQFDVAWKLVREGIANDLRNELVRVCPVDTGYLKNSISVVRRGMVLLITMPDYALYVEFGTPPHIIKPRRKKALRFDVGGESVVVRSVRHPGTMAQPFIRNTIRTKLKSIIVKNVDRFLR